MTTEDAIVFFKGHRRLAEVLDIWPQAVYAWGPYPPMSRQYELAIKSKGALEVTPISRQTATAGEADVIKT